MMSDSSEPPSPACSSSSDPWLIADRCEYHAAYSYDDFEVWRLRTHPEHLTIPEFPTGDSSLTAEPKVADAMLQYQNPFTTSESAERQDALLGEPKRSSTKLPHNNSILVDIGSRINLIGRNTAQEFITAAETNGCKATTVAKQKPLFVHGVGAGSAQCSETLQSQIAVQYTGDKPQVANYDANIADGCGADLPAIFGLDSMTKGDAVILLREGKRCIAFPGKGGYRIEWSDGTKILPITESLSGHLVIPCDSYENADAGCAHAFVTDHLLGTDLSVPDDSGKSTALSISRQ